MSIRTAAVTVHLPPPNEWRRAQARARVCGLWLDMTADGRVLRGVVEQVDQDLCQSDRIDVTADLLAWQRHL